MSRFDWKSHSSEVKQVAHALCQRIGCAPEFAPLFYEESLYLPDLATTLKILVVSPKEDIPPLVDITFKGIKKALQTEALTRELISFFSSKLVKFRAYVENSKQFLNQVSELSLEELNGVFGSFSPEAIDKAKLAFKLFIQSIASKKVQSSYLYLDELIPSSVDECSFDPMAFHDPYTQGIALKEVLLTLSPPFFQKQNDSEDTLRFLTRLHNIMRGVSLSFRLEAHTKLFDAFQSEMCICRDLLRINMKVDGIDVTRMSIGQASSRYTMPRFTMPVIPSALDGSFKQLLGWVINHDHDDELDFLLTNQMIVSKLFEYHYRNYLVANDNLATRASTSAHAAVASLSSFLMSASSRFVSLPVLSASPPQCKVDKFLEAIKNARSPGEFAHAISVVLTLRGDGIESVHKQFAIALVKQFLRDLMTKAVVIQMQDNPHLQLQSVEHFIRESFLLDRINAIADFFIQSLTTTQRARCVPSA